MSTEAFAPTPGSAVIVRPRSRGPWTFVTDTALLTRRSLLLFLRTPQLIVASAVLPIMFVLLFRYVFGGSIHVPGFSSYVDFLIPGIMVQTALFGGSASAVGAADDLTKGVTDRFRSMPTNRAAILTARTLADFVRLAYTLALVVVVGLLVGFRFHDSTPRVAAGIGIVLLFGYACSWLFTMIGLAVRNVEAATTVGFLVSFPLVFASSIFTSTSTFPHWLETFADHQPVSHIAHAARALTQGHDVGNAAANSIVWSLGILVVAAVLATWRFRKL